MWSTIFAIGSLALSSLVSAVPAQKRGCSIGVCDFDSAKSPKCWGNYSLATNYYEEYPDTGVTREYWFDVQNGTAAVDGVERLVLTVNGTIPGPTIYADWGDWIVVHVRNRMQNNGTSIHWHGIRQLLTNQEDGVASITQCPTAPGDTMTYKWRATQYGHSWYHSHFFLQAWNGVFGGIVINGPASAPYDEDKGILFLNDWYHNTTDQLWELARTPGLAPSAQNGLINGTNVNVAGDAGKRFETIFTSGVRHRLRIVNGAIDTHFKFSIDNHNFTVIANDLVPIEPFTTSVLSVGIGQRYDVIVEANQAVGDYWMRASPDTACSVGNENQDNIMGIVRYDSSSTSNPNSTAYTWAEDCVDESMDNLVPYLRLDAEAPAVEDLYDLALDSSTGVFLWTLNGTSFLSDWGVPTLQQAVEDVTVFNATQHVIQVESKNEWVYVVIQSALALAHPIHLHGHDFFVLAQEEGISYNASTVNLTTTNPTRRDVAILPAAGYLVLGFITDNPGVWLMHCHIGWHASEGFALQFIEQSSEIGALVDVSELDDSCKTWNAYAKADDVVQDDSGI